MGSKTRAKGKVESHGAAVICDGRLFHIWVDATQNARLPTTARRVHWTAKNADEAECK